MTLVVRAALTDQPIDSTEHENLVAHESAGAVVAFAGVVRDHDGGRTVTRLEYSSHPTAEQTLAEVVAEGQRAGLLPAGPTEEIAHALWGTVHGLALLVSAGHLSAAQAEAALVTVVRD